MAGDIVGHRSDSVLEVDQVEKQVGEGRDFGVELAAGDHGVGLDGRLAHCEVLEALHEADLVAIGQVVQVLEEGLLFGIVLEVVAVLLDTLTCHILTV